MGREESKINTFKKMLCIFSILCGGRSSELAPQKTCNSFQRAFIALKMRPGLSDKCVAMCMFSQPHSALFKKTSSRIALFRDSVSGLTRTLNHIIIISSMKTRLCSGGNARSSRRVLLGCMCFLGRRFMERKKLLIYCKEKNTEYMSCIAKGILQRRH